MKPTTLSLAEFCHIVGEPRETVRAMIWRGESPFPVHLDANEKPKRTFTGPDLLSWCLFTQLRNMGVGAELAGQTVRDSGAVKAFFASAQSGAFLHLVLCPQERRKEDRSIHRVLYSGVHTPEEIAGMLSAEIVNYGEDNLQGQARLGFTGFLAVSVFTCWQRCKDAVRAQGLILCSTGTLYEGDE
jgi:hypothetical protein